MSVEGDENPRKAGRFGVSPTTAVADERRGGADAMNGAQTDGHWPCLRKPSTEHLQAGFAASLQRGSTRYDPTYPAYADRWPQPTWSHAGQPDVFGRMKAAASVTAYRTLPDPRV